MTAPLIYDIGANNGDDSAFYLAKGFRVVAIEADPKLCAALQERFADEIADGRYVVENVGVSDKVETLDFYVSDFSEWSSFVKQGKATGDVGHTLIQVQTAPLSRLVARHGKARYLKIDIEGFELPALSTLSRDLPLPEFLSYEVNIHWRANLEQLVGLGYSRFQIVRQGKGFVPDPPQPAREGSYVAQSFRNSHSGCFGLELPQDNWFAADAFDAVVQAEMDVANARMARGERRGWHDIHCHRESPRGSDR